jgi:hypothetical protein
LRIGTLIAAVWQEEIEDGLRFEVGPDNLTFSVILDDGAP